MIETKIYFLQFFKANIKASSVKREIIVSNLCLCMRTSVKKQQMKIIISKIFYIDHNFTFNFILCITEINLCF